MVMSILLDSCVLHKSLNQRVDGCGIGSVVNINYYIHLTQLLLLLLILALNLMATDDIPPEDHLKNCTVEGQRTSIQEEESRGTDAKNLSSKLSPQVVGKTSVTAPRSSRRAHAQPSYVQQVTLAAECSSMPSQRKLRKGLMDEPQPFPSPKIWYLRVRPYILSTRPELPITNQLVPDPPITGRPAVPPQTPCRNAAECGCQRIHSISTLLDAPIAWSFLGLSGFLICLLHMAAEVDPRLDEVVPPSHFN